MSWSINASGTPAEVKTSVAEQAKSFGALPIKAENDLMEQAVALANAALDAQPADASVSVVMHGSAPQHGDTGEHVQHLHFSVIGG